MTPTRARTAMIADDEAFLAAVDMMYFQALDKYTIVVTPDQ